MIRAVGSSLFVACNTTRRRALFKEISRERASNQYIHMYNIRIYIYIYMA